jgi:hypothetical protein
MALALAYFGVVVASGLFGGLVYLLAGMPRPTPQEVALVNSLDGKLARPEQCTGR